jgi:hypothetical protein
MAPVKKLREFFVLQAVTEKNFSRFLKICFHFPKSASEEDWSKSCERGFFGGRVVFWTPLRW